MCFLILRFSAFFLNFSYLSVCFYHSPFLCFVS
jgi:hypothetical protein